MSHWATLPDMISPGTEARTWFPFHARHPEAVYLDHACMAPKSRPVVEAMRWYLEDAPVCGSRSPHRLGREVGRAVEDARERLHRFVRAPPGHDVIFTRNATEALNLVARGLPGDGAVLVGPREHNSNLVPWQRRGVVDAGPEDADGALDLDWLRERLAAGGVAAVSIGHVNNVDGVSNDVRGAARVAHEYGLPVVADGAQALPHQPIDLAELAVDAYAVSLHKAGGPSGVGALIIDRALLETIEPLVMGGSTVSQVTFADHEALPPPARFEAGLQDYGGIIASGAALEFLERVGMKAVRDHSGALAASFRQGLQDAGWDPLRGPTGTPLVAFHDARVDAHLVAALLDEEGVFLRAGRHCSHAWFHRTGTPPLVRASFWCTNTEEDVERSLDALRVVRPAAEAASR